MNILHIIIKCIGAVIMALAVLSVYDARKLTNKFFGTSDTNTATRTFKIVGMILFCISGIIIIWG